MSNASGTTAGTPSGTSRGSFFGRVFSTLERGFALPGGRRGRLIRPRYPRVIAGVCSGLAEYFGWDATVLRVAVVILAVASSGLLVVGYAAAWVLIPEGVYALADRAGVGGTAGAGSGGVSGS